MMDENPKFAKKGDFYYRRVEPVLKIVVILIALAALTLVVLDKLGKI